MTSLRFSVQHITILNPVLVETFPSAGSTTAITGLSKQKWGVSAAMEKFSA